MLKDWLRRVIVHWPAIVFVTVLNVAILWYGATTKEQKQQAAADLEARQAVFTSQMSAKADSWVTVMREKEIAPGETMRLLEVSDKLGLLGTRCLLYTNSALRFSQLFCSEKPTF